tara:strand:- start:7358 stop:7846 length:489 start_codon:yes stop_codon:yes gene_type:complete
MYLNMAEDDYVKKSFYSFLLNKKFTYPTEEFVAGYNRAFNIVLNSTNHYYDPVCAFLPYNLDFYKESYNNVRTALNQLKNTGKYTIFLVHFDGGFGKCFLNKGKAKTYISERLNKGSFHDGVEISISTRKIFISNLAEYIDEKELIQTFGENWKEYLSKNTN